VCLNPKPIDSTTMAILQHGQDQREKPKGTLELLGMLPCSRLWVFPVSKKMEVSILIIEKVRYVSSCARNAINLQLKYVNDPEVTKV